MNIPQASATRVARAWREARSRSPLFMVPLLVAGALPAHAQSFEVGDLGSLGGDRVAAYAINDAGWIVGAALDGRPEKVAFVKPPGAPMIGLLGELGTRNAGSGGSDVNAGGEALLYHSFRSSRVSYNLFLWTAGEGTREIASGPEQPVGLDDDANVVVNGLVESTERRKAFESRRTAQILEAPDYVARTLPELSASASGGTRALGVSGRGDVVGYAPDADDAQRPVLWDAGTHALHVLPSALDGKTVLAGRARAINARGTIVGELDVPRAEEADGTPCAPEVADDGCVAQRVVVWRGPEHALTDLGPGSVEAINGHDVAVGDRLWDVPRARVIALPASGPDALIAHDINDDNVLVGERGLRAIRARYVP